MRPLSYRDVAAMILRLGDSANNIVLIGGQAVNFWAEHYAHRAPELGAHGPYTSKDIDFCGSRAAVVDCARRLGARALLPSDFDATPNSGQLVFVDDSGAERVIDFLAHPFGLDAPDILRTSFPVEVLDEDGKPAGVGFRVMHPERCLESRVHNVMGLPGYDKPTALSQARASIVCVRELFRDLLAAERVRPVLDLSERIFHFCHDHPRGRAIFKRHGIDPFEAVITDSRLPREFNEVRYPQMLARLGRRRARAG